MPGMLVSRRSSTLRAMPTGVLTVARPSDSCRLVDGLLRGWANKTSTAILRRGSRLEVEVLVVWWGVPMHPHFTVGLLRGARSATRRGRVECAAAKTRQPWVLGMDSHDD